jgi:hypothetical protein
LAEELFEAGVAGAVEEDPAARDVSRVEGNALRASYSPGDECYDFKNIFAEKIGEKIAFLTRNKAKLYKNLIITLFFFPPKFVKNRRRL